MLCIHKLPSLLPKEQRKSNSYNKQDIHKTKMDKLRCRSRFQQKNNVKNFVNGRQKKREQHQK